jgi:isopenicillin-N N-acyltransferase like protein
MIRIVRKIFKWLFLTLASLLLVFVIWTLIVARDYPPEVKDLSSLDLKRINQGDSIFTYGNNWLKKSSSGLWEMYIEGEPFDRGAAFGKLTSELLHYQESAFYSQITELVPSLNYLMFLKYFIAWFNRDLDKNIPEEYRLEIYGTSFSSSPEFDFIGTAYQRQLNYHAAHDIGHALQSLMMTGCTSFSVWDDMSADSSLIVGRNFDFFAGDKFSENKIVCFYNPSSGHKFMMVTWADMTGVVSGMNEKGLTVTINAARSSIPLKAAMPVSLLAREILQYSSTIREAEDIASKRRMFVSESILIGSAIDGRSAIIEKSPRRQGLLQAEGNSIVCANHFRGETFSNDKRNLENIEGSDSRSRYERMEELILREENIDVNTAASILRDMKGLKDQEIGMGNPLAVNQLIAHHSVIFKPGKQLAWVSTSPWQLGKMKAYDLTRVFSLNSDSITAVKEVSEQELEIPADTFLYSRDYRAYLDYLRMTWQLKKLTGENGELPVGFEADYEASNPRLYSVFSNLGDHFTRTGNYSRAADYYKIALTKALPGSDKKDELVSSYNKALKKSDGKKH